MPVRRPPSTPALAVALASAALLLSACTADEPSASTAAVSARPEVVTADVPMRTVLDDVARGVTLPAEPQRVMVLNEELLDATLMLGVEPVGISLGRDQPTAAAYLQDRKPDLTYLVNAGLPDAPDVGAVLTAEPDLVLAGDATTPEVLAGLEAIAPTYVARVDGTEWTATLHSVAEALGREDRAATWLGGYDWRTQQVRQQIADAGNAGRSVALVLWTAEGPVVLDETSFAARVAASVGLTPTGRTGGAPGPVVPVSAIPASDRLFVFVRDALGVDGDALEAAMASAEVRALPAVAAGNVAVVDGSAWATRGGPAAAHLVLDDLLAAFGA
ncbi:ABC transporter substrate-binding protein [Cellulomonas cellasea]|uniref:Fe/B12 periplasmic-binding domain-containing protein n=1 Tax=Cellulomonas cellasea DSM 20118 TaxID=1408250 RepID=A0A0A0BA11_9CELL|nr:ABC transporter substrate-binding protein [Cellulomonas cellasea]KGM03725.1 hypothetical protein Q760_14845 [Cellulomonas cellasea DSM 20118]